MAIFNSYISLPEGKFNIIQYPIILQIVKARPIHIPLSLCWLAMVGNHLIILSTS